MAKTVDMITINKYQNEELQETSLLGSVELSVEALDNGYYYAVFEPKNKTVEERVKYPSWYNRVKGRIIRSVSDAYYGEKFIIDFNTKTFGHERVYVDNEYMTNMKKGG